MIPPQQLPEHTWRVTTGLQDARLKTDEEMAAERADFEERQNHIRREYLAYQRADSIEFAAHMPGPLRPIFRKLNR